MAKKKNEFRVEWRTHTPNLLKEVLCNESAWTLRVPLQIFMNQLHEVAECASRINDPELNKLMVRLTLYACADPESKDYDAELVKKILETN